MVLKHEDIEYIKKKSNERCKKLDLKELRKEEECKKTIIDTYEEGYNNAYELFEQQSAKCGITPPNTFDFFNFFAPAEPPKPKRPVFKLIPEELEEPEQCTNKFDIYNTFLDVYGQFRNKTIREYLKNFKIEIKGNGNELDFSECIIPIKEKIINFTVEQIKDKIIKNFGKYKNCNLLKKINIMNFKNQNFTKDYALELIPSIFINFENVNTIYFGVTPDFPAEILKYIESKNIAVGNSKGKIKCTLIKEQLQQPYILATRELTSGGKSKKSIKNKKLRNKKSRKTYKKYNFARAK